MPPPNLKTAPVPARGLETPAPSRMKLAAIRDSKENAPLRWLVYGVDKIGKSTFASMAPSPIFMSAESGLKRIAGAKMFPQPVNFQECLDIVDELATTEHPYKTFVIDTVDWIEPIIWAEVCRQANVKDIEAVGGGFQKGYILALDVWRTLLRRIEVLHEKKNMEVGFLAHALIVNFDNPAGPSYKRYQAATNQKAYDLLKQWVDVVAFASHEDVYGDDKGGTKGKIKGVSTGKRLLYLERTAAYDAGNRFGMPPVIEFSYDAFARACKGVPVEELHSMAVELAAGNEKALAYIETIKDDQQALQQTINHLKVSG
jgi:hypothetical protein